MLAVPGSQVVKHPSAYRVDGEVGRFEFETFDVQTNDGRTVFRGLDLLPRRTGKQWYPTIGFKQHALLLGALDCSYRKTANSFNLQRRQLQGGTPLNTLRDVAESEGQAVLAAMEQETQRAFAEHGFTEEGQPREPKPITQEPPPKPERLPLERVQEAWATVSQEMRERGFTAEQVAQAEPNDDHDYESPGQTTDIHLDDVCIKKQKLHRKQAAPVTDDEELKRVHTTVARIEHQGQGFTLVNRSVAGVLLFVLGVLLRNDLVKHRLRFFVDGQRTLQDAILAFFGWHPAVSLILDWFHLVKKCKETLSMALKGKVLRNEHARQVLRLLWYGLVDEAISHLRAISESEIKEAQQVEKLIGYFERNRAWIPCYAMRRKLALRNSSNPAERTNNLIASQRQKKNGMSWSSNGSQALSALATVCLNHLDKKWLSQREFPLTFALAT